MLFFIEIIPKDDSQRAKYREKNQCQIRQNSGLGFNQNPDG
jgi:hypothetical protein